MMRPGVAEACTPGRGRRGVVSGLALIEVLVALLLLSFGALGGAAVQLQALQATQAAYRHSVASLIAADAGERLWLAMAQGGFGTGWLDSWREQRDCASAAGHVCLPGLDVSIAGTDGMREIVVSWTEPGSGDDAMGRVELRYRVRVFPDFDP